MPLDVPLMLGPFVINEAGQIAPGSPQLAPGFSLSWRGRSVHVQIESSGFIDDHGCLALTVKLGRIPSTGGPASTDVDIAERQAARARLFSILRDLPALLPERWHVFLMPDHCVTLSAAMALPLPSTVADLITEVTLFLLALAPYLDIVESEGLAGLSSADEVPAKLRHVHMAHPATAGVRQLA